jgi:translation elongation factor EF-4
LDAVIERISSPKIYSETGLNERPVSDQELKALVFDSQYDPYR